MSRFPAWLWAAAVLAGCLGEDRVAGTSHETETGNSISGILKAEDDLPDSGIAVHLRSAAYARPEGSGPDPAGEWADSTVTGPGGAFTLRLPAKRAGPAFLEAVRDTGTALRLAVEAGGAKPVELGARFLGRTGTLQGAIDLPAGDTGTVFVQLLGTARFVRLDSLAEPGAGTFSFRHLPAGAYTVRAFGLRPARGPVEAKVTVPPGETGVLPPLNLSASTGSARGRVLMPEGTRGRAEVEAVGTGLRARADSLGRWRLDGLPEGKITLRAYGIRPLRDTVELAIAVRKGEVQEAAEMRLSRLAVLIVDGINNHDWVRLTKSFRALLSATGRFRVDVLTTPGFSSDSSKWLGWNPDFGAHDAVLMDFSDVKDVYGASWPAAAREALRAYVAGGGGLIVTQSAQSAFAGWDAYRDMLGLAWGGQDRYPGMFLDSALAPRAVPVGQDSSATVRGAFAIRSVDTAHPIQRGFPASWRHAEDGIDVGLRGPARGMAVLAAFAHPVSGRLEPAAWTVAYGKGRVFNTSLGDVVEGGPDDAVRCAGFRTLLARAAEWAASSRVTLPLPGDFPADSVSLRPAP